MIVAWTLAVLLVSAPAAVAKNNAEIRYVLVKEGAELLDRMGPERAARASDAPPVQDSGIGAGVHADVFRLIAQDGDWLEIETVSADEGEGLCFPPDGHLVAMKLRMFVRQEDAEQVLTKKFKMSYANQTGFELKAGAAVRGVDSGWTSVATPRLGFLAEVPADRIGWSFGSAPGPKARSPQIAGHAFPEGDAVVFGIGDHVFSTPRPLPLTKVRTWKKKRLVEVRDACGVVTLRIDQANVVTQPTSSLAGRIVLGSIVRLPPGTALFWPDGRPAGEVRKTGGATETVAPQLNGTRVCFRVPLDSASATDRAAEDPGNPGRSLPLCVDATVWKQAFPPREK
jgi:hypothetical protein